MAKPISDLSARTEILEAYNVPLIKQVMVKADESVRQT